MGNGFGFFKINIVWEKGLLKKTVEIYFPTTEDVYRQYENMKFNGKLPDSPKYVVSMFEGNPDNPKLISNDKGKPSFLSEGVFNEELKKYKNPDSIDADIELTLVTADDKKILDSIFRDYGLEEK